MNALADLFGDGDEHRFQLGLRRGQLADFFADTAESKSILAERAAWIQKNPERYLALSEAGEPLVLEFSELAKSWKAAERATAAESNLGGSCSPLATLSAWARALEPDFILLSQDEAGAFRLRAGALVFPTGWAIGDKLGATLDQIHGVVPGLNPALGSQIHQFLNRLKPEAAFFRSNWGLASTSERNLHPALDIPDFRRPLALEHVWLRIEHQCLARMPSSGGVLFGIRIANIALSDVLADTATAHRLLRALQSLPEPLSIYKRVEPIRVGLLQLIQNKLAAG